MFETEDSSLEAPPVTVSDGFVQSSAASPPTYADGITPIGTTPPIVAPSGVTPQRAVFLRFNRQAVLLTAVAFVAMILLGSAGLLLSGKQAGPKKQAADNSVSDYSVGDISLQGVQAGPQLEVGQAEQLTVNGQLNVKSGLVLEPMGQPASPTTGEIYYDGAQNQPYYYNGQQFISLAPSGHVTSIQGQSGVVNFTGGSGISVNGTTITNSGVTELSGTVNQISVNQATGNITLSLPQDIGPHSTPTFVGITTSNLTARPDDSGLTIGSLTQTLALQGSVTTVSDSDNGNTTQIIFATPTGNNTLTVPDISGEICTSANNCQFQSSGSYINLQATTPGTAQAGNFNIVGTGIVGSLVAGDIKSTTAEISGQVSAGSFSGDGIDVTNVNAAKLGNQLPAYYLDAGNINTGTLSDARLSTNVVLASANNTLTGDNSFSGANTFTNSSNSFTGDGSNLTNLNASVITNGTLSDARLNPDVTLAGNQFNGANQLVELTNTGVLPTLSGVNLTNLNATNLASGTLSDARLSTNVTLQGNSFNGANQLVQLDNSGDLPAVSGAALTNLNGTAINSGTVAVAYGGTGATTAANARVNLQAAQSGANSDITNLLDLTAITPGSALTIGATGQNLTLQGATTQLTSTSAGFTSTLGFTAPTANDTIVLPDASGTICLSTGNCEGIGGPGANNHLSNLASVALNVDLLPAAAGSVNLGSGSLPFGALSLSDGAANSYTISGAPTTGNKSIVIPTFTGGTATLCLTTGNCAGAGTGDTGTGTVNTIALFSGTQQIGNSIITQDSGATTVSIGGQLTATGQLNANGGIVTNNATINTGTGIITGDGSGLINLNGSSISSGTVADTYLSTDVTLQGNTFNGASELLQLTNTGILPVLSGLNLTNLNATNLTSGTVADNRLSANVALLNQNNQVFSGTNIFQPTTGNDSVTFFRVQNAAGSTTLLDADTTHNRVGIGTASPAYPLDVSGDINSAGIYRVGGTQISSADLSNDSNLAKLSGAQTFSAINTFSASGTALSVTNDASIGGTASISTLSVTNSGIIGTTLAVHGSSVTIGTTTQQGSLVLNDGNGASSKTATLQSVTTLGQNTVYTLPDPGSSTVTICLSTGNCAGSGGGITGSGTSGQIAKFNGSGSITSSTLSESGTTLTASGSVVIQGSGGLSLGVASTTDGSIKFYNAAGSHTVSLQAPASDPASNLVFKLPSADGASGSCLKTDGSGNLSFTGCTGGVGGGVTSLDSQTGVLSLANSSGASGTITIDNASTTQKGIAQFNSSDFSASAGAIDTIQGIATTSAPTFNGLTLNSALSVTTGGATIIGNTSVTGNLNISGQYQVGSTQISSANLSNDSNLAKLNGTGPQIFTGNNKFTGTFLAQNATDSTTAFQIQDAAGTTTLFDADTTDGYLLVGSATPVTSGAGATTLQVTGSGNFTTGLYVNGVAVCTVSTCAGGSGGTAFVQGGNSFAAPAVLGTNDSNSLSFRTDGINQATIAVGGATAFKNSTDSTTAFQIQNAAGTDNLLVADTSNQAITVNNAFDNGSSVLRVNGQSANANSNLSGVISSITDTTTAASTTASHFALKGVFSKTGTGVQGGFADGGADIEATVSGGSLGELDGVYSRVQAATGGTVTNAYNFVADADFSDRGGTVTNRAGLQVNDFIHSTTNQYGVYVSSLTSGTNNYAIYTAGTTGSLFGGQVTANGGLLTNNASVNAGTGNLTAGTTLLKNASNSTTAFQIQNATSSPLFVADTTNLTVGIAGASTTAGYTLNVTGTINASSQIYVNGSAVCTVSSGCGGSGIGYYINNGTSTQTGNFNIQSASASSIGAVIQGASGQTADLLDLKDGSGNLVNSISNTGNELVKPSTNSTTAFQVQDTSSNSVLDVDTSNDRVGIGTNAPSNPLTVTSTSTTTAGGTFVNGLSNITAAPTSTLSVASDYVAFEGYGQSASNNLSGSTRLFGDYGSATYSGTTGTLGTAIGERGIAINNSTGTISAAIGLDGLTLNGSAGVISSAYSLDVESPINSGGGTITTAYGAYIGAQKVTGVTSGYGIYQAGTSDTNFFNAATDTFRTGTNSTSAFLVQNAVGTNVLSVDTTNKQVYLTNLGATNGSILFEGGGSVGSLISFNGNGAYVANNGGSNEFLQLNAATADILNVSNTEVARFTSTGLGIGVTSPVTALDVAGSISRSQNNVRTYQDVYSSSLSNTTTGTYELVLPNGWSASSMLNFTISGYNFTGNVGAWQAVVSGEVYTPSSFWQQTSAQISGSAPFSSVRLAYDTSLSKLVLLLGTTSTSWSFPAISVNQVIVSYGSQDLWGSGYSSAFLTSEANISTINSPAVQQLATTGNAFIQGGNSFSASAVLGTNDNNSLLFKTNNTTRLTLDTSGNATLTGNLTVQGGNAAYFVNASGNASAYLYDSGGSGQNYLATNASRFYISGAELLGGYSGSLTSGTGLGVLGASEFQNALTVDGTQYFGTAQDTNLYRGASGLLRTDGALSVGSYFLSSTASGGLFFSPTWTSGIYNDGANGTGNIQIRNGSASNIVTIAQGGATIFQNSTDSTSAFQIQNAGGTQVLNVDTTNSIVSVQGANSNATLGSELMVSNTDFSTGSYWSGAGWTFNSTSATHTSGTTAATYAGFTPVAGTTYQVTYTFSGASGNGTDNVIVGLGGATGFNIYSASGTDTEVVTASNTTGLNFTPSTSWAGSITSVSVKAVTASNSALNLLNSSGVTSLEVRAPTDTHSTFVGLQSGMYTTTGASNTGFGSLALKYNTSGSFNTASGYAALYSNGSGGSNTASGYAALFSNTSGSFNTASGWGALNKNTTGNNNTAAGLNALFNNTTGSSNVANGGSALTSNTTGSHNVAVGFAALQNTTGSNNVGIGYFTGDTSVGGNANTTGSKNTFLGYASGPGSATQLQNATAIGAGSVVSQSDSLVLGCVSGVNTCTANTQVGIGTATPGATLDVQAVSTNVGLNLNTTGTGNLLQLQNSGTPVLTVGSTGSTLFKPSTNSTTAFQVQNAAGTQVLNVDTTNSIVSVQGTNSSATLGSELMTSTTNFTSGWSGSGWTFNSTSAAHTSGTTPATYTGFTPVAGTVYQITFTFSGASGNGTDAVTPTIGGVAGEIIYAASDTNETQLITTTGTGSLAFTPTTSWAGTITSVSVEAVTTSNSAFTILNSAGAASIEVRASTASNNTFLGVAAGRANTTGTFNTAVGQNALLSNTTGTRNTALGGGTLKFTTTGIENTAVGQAALFYNTTGSYNVANGVSALQSNTTGTRNTAIGTGALQGNTTGSNNIAIGYAAGVTSVTGNSNATGSQNTFLGYGSGPGIATQLQNATAIGAKTVVNQDDSLVLGCVSGVNGCTANTKVGIDNASPSYTLDVAGDVRSQNVTDSTAAFQVQNASGTTLLGVDTSGSNININGNLNYSSNPAANDTTATRLFNNSGSLYLQNGSGGSIVFRNKTAQVTASISDTGAALFQNSTNSTTAFQIQNSTGTSLLTADTTNNDIVIGNSPTIFSDGFESGSMSAWTNSGMTVDTQSHSGTYAGVSSVTSGGTSYAQTNLASSTYLDIKAYVYINSASAGTTFFSNSNQSLYTDTSNHLSWYNGVTITTFNSSTSVSTGAWHLIEWQIQNGASGYSKAYLDGTLVINQTANLGTSAWAGLTMGQSTAYGSGSMTEHFDDISVYNTPIYNSAGAALYVTQNATTGRSINAAGTINASGADYAEWIPWSGAKPDAGSVVTYQGSDYVVSSPGTAAFVGNDNIDETNAIMVTFSGQVPVKVTGAVKAGDILVNNGDGTAKAIDSGSADLIDYLAKIGIAQAASTDTGVKLVPAAIGTTSSNAASAALQAGNASFNDLNVSGATSLTDLTVSGTATLANLTVSGATSVADITVNGHIITAGGQPTAVAQTNAGQNATVSISGTDTTGTITITTGNIPTAGDLAQVNFSKLYGAAPHIVLSPSNDAASAMRYYKGATSASGFMFDAHDAPAANTTYTYDYFIAQ